MDDLFFELGSVDNGRYIAAATLTHAVCILVASGVPQEEALEQVHATHMFILGRGDKE